MLVNITQINSNHYVNSISFQFLISGVEYNAQTHDSFTDLIELGHGEEHDMEPQDNEFSTSEETHQLLNAQFKLTIEPILKQIGKLCSLLAEWNELSTAGNSEATGSKREDTSASPADNR